MKSYLLILAAITSLAVSQVDVKKSVFSVHESTQFKVMPRGVLNLKTKETLVVWEKHPGNHPGHSLWGRLLNSSGNTAGPEFLIVSGPNTYGPSLTYNAQRNEYLLVYANEGTSVGFAIFGQRLNAKGRRLGTAVRLSLEADSALPVNNERPLAIWNARTGNYQIFWQKDGFSSSANITEGLYGAVFNGTLSAIQDPTLIVSAKQDGAFVILPFITDAAIHPITGRLLLAFYEYAPGFGTSSGPVKVFYFVGNLDPDLNAINASDFTKIKQGTSILNGDIRFAFLTDGSGLVIFHDTASLKLRKIDLTGKLTGPLKPAFHSPLNNTSLALPSIAQTLGAGCQKSVILAIRDPQNLASQRGFWTQVIDCEGNPSGPPMLVDPLTDFAGESTLVALASSASTVDQRFAAVYEEGRQFNVPPTAAESTGLILLNLNFRFP